jgi:hypothetical protein
VPADTWKRVTFRTVPRWSYLLLALCGLPFLLFVFLRTGVEATGQLPFARPAAARRTVLKWVYGGGMIVGLLVFGLTLPIANGTISPTYTRPVGVVMLLLACAGGVLTVAMLVALLRLAPTAVVRRQPKVRHDTVVVFRRVHPNFARGVLAQQAVAPRGERRAPRPG